MKATESYSNLYVSTIPCVVSADDLHVDTIDIGGPPPSAHALMSRLICGLLQSMMCPGHMVARWAVDSGLTDVTPDESTVDMFRQAHWDGYGNRDVAKSVGVACYFGKRGTNMLSPTPVEGPGNAVFLQYFWLAGNAHPEWMYFANKNLSQMAPYMHKI